jgi:hypothetical protein
MNLETAKKKAFGLIEELNPNSEYLTDDPDLQAKANETFNQVMFELCRMKKIPQYVELKVSEGDLIRFADIEKACGYEIYQVGTIGGVLYEPKADGTVFKIQESGTAEINCYVYPERITEKTKDKAYEFELSADLLEILPYGVAADLLLADVSTNYGRAYREEYERKLSRLDTRYQSGSIYIEGGIEV